MREKIAGSLIEAIAPATQALLKSETTMASHVTTDTSAATMAIMPKTRQSMLDSVALNPVSGKRRSKETIQARPVWTVYLTARVKFTAPR